MGIAESFFYHFSLTCIFRHWHYLSNENKTKGIKKNQSHGQYKHIYEVQLHHTFKTVYKTQTFKKSVVFVTIWPEQSLLLERPSLPSRWVSIAPLTEYFPLKKIVVSSTKSLYVNHWTWIKKNCILIFQSSFAFCCGCFSGEGLFVIGRRWSIARV
jgi:hypothetical protein